MKFLTDENIGFGVINPLRKLGYDIQSILEISPGLSDTEVLAYANSEERILLTADKDFGELVYSKKLVHSGIILLRLENDSAKNKYNILRTLLKEHRKELEKSFTVVTEDKIRIRKIDK